MRLVISTGRSVISVDRDGRNLRTLLSFSATYIDFDLADQLLFFINKTDKQVSYDLCLNGDVLQWFHFSISS